MAATFRIGDLCYYQGHRAIVRGRFPVLTESWIQRVWFTDLDSAGKYTRVCDEADLVPTWFPPMAKLRQMADLDVPENVEGA